MEKKNTDIEDDEIRIISSSELIDNPGAPQPDKQISNNKRWIIFISLAALLAVALLLWFLPSDSGHSAEAEYDARAENVNKNLQSASGCESAQIENKHGYVSVSDTTVGNAKLQLLFPENVVPSLAIGAKALSDTSAILMTQAADVRADNHAILGTFVLNGNLISKGESKSGFCSIINGDITIGASDATSMLEAALMNDGDFFRQYPLVVAGQIVENKPKGKSIRRALAQLDGKVCIIISRNRLTYHDFAQALANIGVRNAICLVGGDGAPGFYVDENNSRIPLGTDANLHYENVNFIVWR